MITAITGNVQQAKNVYFSPTRTGRFYSMEHRTNLLTGSWSLVQTNIPGYAGWMFLDDVHTNDTGFYRIRVDLP